MLHAFFDSALFLLPALEWLVHRSWVEEVGKNQRRDRCTARSLGRQATSIKHKNTNELGLFSHTWDSIIGGLGQGLVKQESCARGAARRRMAQCAARGAVMTGTSILGLNMKGFISNPDVSILSSTLHWILRRFWVGLGAWTYIFTSVSPSGISSHWWNTTFFLLLITLFTTCLLICLYLQTHSIWVAFLSKMVYPTTLEDTGLASPSSSR